MSLLLIDPGTLPATPDPHGLLSAATGVLDAALAVQTACDTTTQTWNLLPNTLDAPGHIDPLFTALAPVTSGSAALTTAVRSMHHVVETFAGEIQTVRRRSAALEDEITAFYIRLGVDVLRPGSAVLLEPVVHAVGLHDELDTLAHENTRLLHDVRALNGYWEQVQHDTVHALLTITRGHDDNLPRITGTTPTPTSKPAGLSAILALESLAAAAKQGKNAVRRWRTDYPALAALLQAAPPDAQFVSNWWTSLPATARTALLAGIPTLIGNLNGVPYDARSQANLTVLRAQVARYTRRVDADTALPPQRGAGGGQLARDAAQLAAYENILLAQTATGGITRFLIELDTSGHPPLAAVALGDPDTAATVTYLVPGAGATTRDMTAWTTAAQHLYLAQNAAAPGSYAVVAWIGYTTPPIPSVTDPDLGVLGNDYAEAGAARLDAALAGLNAVRHDDVTLNVVAHSYGTTTATLALAAADEHVHSLVLLGSAGIDGSIPDAETIHADHVYAGQASDTLPWTQSTQGDNLAYIGRDLGLRLNPMDPDFDATTFGTNGEVDEHGERHGAATTTHDPTVISSGVANGYGYLDPGSESLYNIAQATTSGRGLTSYVWDDYTHLTRAELVTDFRNEVLREGLQSTVIAYQRHGVPDAVITDVATLLGYLVVPVP